MSALRRALLYRGLDNLELGIFGVYVGILNILYVKLSILGIVYIVSPIMLRVLKVAL